MASSLHCRVHCQQMKAFLDIINITINIIIIITIITIIIIR